MLTNHERVNHKRVYSLQPLASWACSGPHQSNTTITLSLFSYTMLSVTLLSLGPGQRQRIEDDGPHFRWVRMDPMHFRFFCTGGWFPHLSSSLHRTSSSSLPEERRPLLRPRWAEFHRMPPPFMVVVSAVVAANATPMARSAGCPTTRALAIDERSLLHP